MNRTTARHMLASAALVVVMTASAACQPWATIVASPQAALPTNSGSPSATPVPQGPPGSAHSTRCDEPSPGQDFARATPASVGIDPAALAYALAATEHPFTASIRVYRHNCLIATGGPEGARGDTAAPVFSMTKSIVALAVGRAVTLGALSLDDSIGDYLDGLDAQRGAITVRELLTQSSGLRFAWANDLAGSTEDSVDQALSMPIAHTPGTTFEYAQTTVNVLVAVVQASVGHDFQSFIDAELFGPVGIERDGWTWMRDGVGNTHGYAWLDLAPRNVARLATLFLHDGVWQGRRIISADYLDAMATPSPTNPGYGFLSQLNAGEWYVESFGNTVRSGPRLSTAPADTVHWSGFLDQDTFIVPSLDMVIVRTGLPMDSRWRYELFRRLAAATPELVAADPSAGPPPEFEIVIKWSQIADLETLLKRLATNTSVG